MNLKSYFLYAMRLLFPKTEKKSNARRSLIGATLCIGISLVPMVVVLTVANGMVNGITERIVTLSSSHIRCYLFENGGLYDHAQSNEEEFKFLCQKLEFLPGVKSAYGEIKGIALAAGMNGRTGASIRAVDEKLFTEDTAFRRLFDLVEGDFNSWGEGVAAGGIGSGEGAISGAFIGQKLSEILKLHTGDTFRLITTRTLPNGKTLPKITTLKVSAIISSGYQELDALWVFLPLSAGFSILGKSGNFEIGVEIENPYGYEIDIVQSRIRRLLLDADNGAGRFAIQTWAEANATQFENFSSTKLMLVLIMALIVIVASVNIASALVMLVIERRREIAILKSVGAKTAGIEFSFLTAGFFTGAFGVLFGVPVGLVLSYNFNRIVSAFERFLNFFASIFKPGTTISLLNPEYYLQNVKISLPLGQIILIVAGTLILSVLVSVMPARRAGKEKPTEIFSS